MRIETVQVAWLVPNPGDICDMLSIVYDFTTSQNKMMTTLYAEAAHSQIISCFKKSTRIDSKRKLLSQLVSPKKRLLDVGALPDSHRLSVFETHDASDSEASSDRQALARGFVLILF